LTRLRWDKLRHKPADPGSMIAAPEDFEIDHWITPAERRRRREETEAANAKLFQRSKNRRFEAMIKKFGRERAIHLGVPISFVVTFFRSREEVKARARSQQEKAEARKKRKAENLLTSKTTKPEAKLAAPKRKESRE
jgi:hypothetical protein